MARTCKPFNQVSIQNSRNHEELKIQTQRDSLNQIYVSFLHPIVEYASVVWNNCTERDKESLEKIKIEAARIVTGLTRSASLTTINTERNMFSKFFTSLGFVYKSMSLKRFHIE